MTNETHPSLLSIGLLGVGLTLLTYSIFALTVDVIGYLKFTIDIEVVFQLTRCLSRDVHDDEAAHRIRRLRPPRDVWIRHMDLGVPTACR